MTSKKKRLLFDVLDHVFEPADEFDQPRPRRSRAGPAAKKRGKSSGSVRKSKSRKTLSQKFRGEINLSIETAGTMALVVIIMIVVAYRVGVGHGEGDAVGPGSPGLSRVAEEEGATFDRSQRHYAIRAATLYYGEFTRTRAREEAESLLKFLWDMGYDDATFTHQPSSEAGDEGRIVIWLGHAQARWDLDELAQKVRSLKTGGKSPFREAFVALFSSP